MSSVVRRDGRAASRPGPYDRQLDSQPSFLLDRPSAPARAQPADGLCPEYKDSVERAAHALSMPSRPDELDMAWFRSETVVTLAMVKGLNAILVDVGILDEGAAKILDDALVLARDVFNEDYDYPSQVDEIGIEPDSDAIYNGWMTGVGRMPRRWSDLQTATFSWPLKPLPAAQDTSTIQGTSVIAQTNAWTFRAPPADAGDRFHALVQLGFFRDVADGEEWEATDLLSEDAADFLEQYAAMLRGQAGVMLRDRLTAGAVLRFAGGTLLSWIGGSALGWSALGSGALMALAIAGRVADRNRIANAGVRWWRGDVVGVRNRSGLTAAARYYDEVLNRPPPQRGLNYVIDEVIDHREGLVGGIVCFAALTPFAIFLHLVKKFHNDYQQDQCRVYINYHGNDPDFWARARRTSELDLARTADDRVNGHKLEPYMWRLRKRIALLADYHNVQDQILDIEQALLPRIQEQGDLYRDWQRALDAIGNAPANPCDADKLNALQDAVQAVEDEVQNHLEAFGADKAWLLVATEFDTLYREMWSKVHSGPRGDADANQLEELYLRGAAGSETEINLSRIKEAATWNSIRRDWTERGVKILEQLRNHFQRINMGQLTRNPGANYAVTRNDPQALNRMRLATTQLRALRGPEGANFNDNLAQPAAAAQQPAQAGGGGGGGLGLGPLRAQQPAQAQASVVDEVFARMRVS